MKKLLAILVLLSHVNFSMFIAQVDEVDTYDANGQPNDDINSLVEYIDEVILDNHPKAQDEDDDNARYFHIVELAGYSFSQQVADIDNDIDNSTLSTKYPPYIEQKALIMFFAIQSPPPKSSSFHVCYA